MLNLYQDGTDSNRNVQVLFRRLQQLHISAADLSVIFEVFLWALQFCLKEFYCRQVHASWLRVFDSLQKELSHVDDAIVNNSSNPLPHSNGDTIKQSQS